MRGFMKRLPGDSTQIHLIPVVDMEDQRGMLESKPQSHISSEVTKINMALGCNPEIIFCGLK